MSVQNRNDQSTMTPFEEYFFADFVPMVGRDQNRMLAYHFILVELLRDLSLTQPDRRKYLAGVFDRVLSRLEAAVPRNRKNGHGTEAQETIQRIFSQAGL